MNSKFAGLAANVAETYRVEIIDAVTDEPIKDEQGNLAYIDVYSTDSEIGRTFDREERARFRRQAMKSRNGIPEGTDQLEENIAKCARLTKAWHLVDPDSKEVIDVTCTVDNAVDLYSAPGMNWLFVQVWAAAANAGNFIRRSPKT